MSKVSQVIVLPNGFTPEELRVGTLFLSLPDIRQKARYFPKEHTRLDISTTKAPVSNYHLGQSKTNELGFGFGQLLFMRFVDETYSNVKITSPELEINLLNDKEGIALTALDHDEIQQWFKEQKRAKQLFMILETYTVTGGTIWRETMKKRSLSGKVSLPVSAAAGPLAPLISQLGDPKLEAQHAVEANIGSGELKAKDPLVVAVQVGEIKMKKKNGVLVSYDFRVRSEEEQEEEATDEKKELALDQYLLDVSQGELVEAEDETAELLIVDEAP